MMTVITAHYPRWTYNQVQHLCAIEQAHIWVVVSTQIFLSSHTRMNYGLKQSGGNIRIDNYVFVFVTHLTTAMASYPF